MKSDPIRRALGNIDDEIIEAADRRSPERANSRPWVRRASLAAAFLLVLTVVLSVSGLFRKGPAVQTETVPTESEAFLEKKYMYRVDAGRFDAYIGGKVIDEKLLGKKLEDAAVTAGWFSAQGKRLSEEHARAEIFEISGISADVAAAVRFLDKLEAETTDHYYVILNPQADLSPVQAYVIPVETQDAGPVPE